MNKGAARQKKVEKLIRSVFIVIFMLFSGFFYHYEYLKMIFDYKLWEEEAVAILASTIASIYGTLLVCVYVSFTFTELVTYPNFKVRHKGPMV